MQLVARRRGWGSEREACDGLCKREFEDHGWLCVVMFRNMPRWSGTEGQVVLSS